MPVRSKKLKCSWKKLEGGFKWLCFEVLLGILHFWALSQAICRRKDGRLLLQILGIPWGMRSARA